MKTLTAGYVLGFILIYSSNKRVKMFIADGRRFCTRLPGLYRHRSTAATFVTSIHIRPDGSREKLHVREHRCSSAMHHACHVCDDRGK